MDDMRNRHHSFPRMPNWMSEEDGMSDLASRMSHVPNWPLSMGRRGGQFRERRGSGGSAMSATSEDDSSYDTAANDKSSQGSGGSAGLDAVSHEIPIMIEAEAPPSMLTTQQQQPQDQGHHLNQPYQQQEQQPQSLPNSQPVNLSGPVPPLVAQLRKSPQYATRTTSAVEDGTPREQARATRCASAPPQMIDQADGGPGSKFGASVNVSPQTRSATLPISPHNNVAKPFVPTYKNQHNSPRAQDPIIEENVQQQQPLQAQQHQQQRQQDQHDLPQQQQQQQQQQYAHPNQYQQQRQQQPEQHEFYQQQPQQQWGGSQPYYSQQQYPEYEQPWQQFYSSDPRAYDGHIYQQPPPQQQPQQQQPQQQQKGNQRPSVIRNIPIFIEGQDNPIVTEERASSLSSSPRGQPMRSQPQQQHKQQQQPQFEQFQQQDRPNQQYNQEQQQPPQQYQNYQQQPNQQFYQQQQQQQYPSHEQQQKVPPQQQTNPEIPIQVQQLPERQPSPQPPPPPPVVRLTPLQKIDQVRTNSQEFMTRVDQFQATKKDRQFLYLDEMLTRALISLDDIDPDGNDEIRQARRSLIKDINSKIALLEKKASAAESSSASATQDSKGNSSSSKENGTAEKGPEPPTEGSGQQNESCSEPPQEQPANKNETKSVSVQNISDTAAASSCGDTSSSSGKDPIPKSDQMSEGTDTKGDVTKEAIPCPAPAIPLPEK